MLAISGSMILGNETDQTWFNEPTFYEDLLRCRKIFRRSDHDCPHDGLVTASHCFPLLPAAELPQCLMEPHLAAPVPPDIPLMVRWSALPFTTPGAQESTGHPECSYRSNRAPRDPQIRCFWSNLRSQWFWVIVRIVSHSGFDLPRLPCCIQEALAQAMPVQPDFLTDAFLLSYNFEQTMAASVILLQPRVSEHHIVCPSVSLHYPSSLSIIGRIKNLISQIPVLGPNPRPTWCNDANANSGHEFHGDSGRRVGIFQVLRINAWPNKQDFSPAGNIKKSREIKVSKGFLSKGFQRFPKNVQRFPNVSKGSKRFQRFPKISKRFQRLPKVSKELLYHRLTNL